ncbi:hypothetical protein N7475_001458 [Penicillium sp. IBT 31633x]|nr:hypothetical protein N7475_001458 [Penicillium sp. IBT 31633x]
MANITNALLNLDPEHISCIGGKTVITCKGCAGNAPRYVPISTKTSTPPFTSTHTIPITNTNQLPRGEICTSCKGRGFNIFICAHCNPTAAATAARETVNTTVATVATQSSSALSFPDSLSHSSSTSYPSPADPNAARSYGRYGDGRDSTSCGRIDSNANKPRNP